MWDMGQSKPLAWWWLGSHARERGKGCSKYLKISCLRSQQNRTSKNIKMCGAGSRCGIWSRGRVDGGAGNGIWSVKDKLIKKSKIKIKVIKNNIK